MNILLITREFPPFVLGGVAYHSYNLARSLIDLGHNVTVLVPSNCYSNKDNSIFNLNELDIVKIHYNELPVPRIWFSRAVKRQLLKSGFTDKFDIIHSHEYIDFKGINLPAILKIHTNLNEKSKYISESLAIGFKSQVSIRLAKAILWPIEKKLELRSLKSSVTRIYISQLAKTKCETYYNFKDSNYRIVYNGVDTNLFNVEPKKNNFDFKKEKYFLFVGGTEYRKGIDIICNCLNQISIDTSSFKVKIVGQYNSDSLHIKAVSHHNNIEFLGRTNQQDLLNLYQNAIALIHPARYEPFGNVVLESLACGTPVILSDENHCGAAEIINKDCGIKINPNNPIELADAMEYIFKNREQYNPEDCRNIAEKYTWERVALETIKCIEMTKNDNYEGKK